MPAQLLMIDTLNTLMKQSMEAAEGPLKNFHKTWQILFLSRSFLSGG